jgi:hypothetical protein
MEKSWNQRYKESGTTLTYKEWRKREDEKMSSFDGAEGISIRSDSLTKAREELSKRGGLKEDISQNTVFGIPKTVLVVGAVIVLAAVSYKLYKIYQKK